MKKTLYSKLNKTQKKKACELNKRVYYNFVVEKQRFFVNLLQYRLENKYGFIITDTSKHYILINRNVFNAGLWRMPYYDELSIDERVKLRQLVENENFSIYYSNGEIEMEQAEAVAMKMFNDEKLTLKLLEVIEQAIFKMIVGVEDMRASIVKSIQRDLNDKEMMEEFFENYAIFDSDSLQIIESCYL